jgi:hypothetical protein
MQRESDNKVLESIKNNNMIFISAQPDNIYFHWQVSLYLYQFSKHNIGDRCYVLFGYTGIRPSIYVQNLMKDNKNIIAYKDTRSFQTKKYIPTIRPYLLKKFFKDRPELGKNVFYHDSDIFLVKLPRFDLMLNDNIVYLSDTVSYIGYEYLKKCGNRYSDKYKNISDDYLVNEMCKVMDIDPILVKNNDKNSGGAQYLLKNIDYTFWDNCENQCVKLYDFFCNNEKKYPIDHHVQKWCTDMWCVLWNCWKKGNITKIHKELAFSWATGTVDDYNKLNIFHLAGITSNNKSDKFHKGMYTKKLVFDAFLQNSKIFNHISDKNATFEYCKVIKEYIQNIYIPYKNSKLRKIYPIIKQENTNIKNIDFKNITSFNIISKYNYNALYIIDNNKKCCGKSIWRSANNKFIIFWNNIKWVLTYSKYISEIGPKCGGIGVCMSEFPYDNNWNIDINIKIGNINRRFINHL